MLSNQVELRPIFGPDAEHSDAEGRTLLSPRFEEPFEYRIVNALWVEASANAIEDFKPEGRTLLSRRFEEPWACGSNRDLPRRRAAPLLSRKSSPA